MTKITHKKKISETSKMTKIPQKRNDDQNTPKIIKITLNL